MTRRRDLMCEDIFGCDHRPETPISEDGEIVGYVCRCGDKQYTVEEAQAREARSDR